ncbi:protein LTO1 homolog [Macadamia integrifolia]|uniref:protein LTO1 homolog n=1 Tax=Macadamia integrifolia TaxID=60698 RepID=UPI001C4F96A0|nr:protein LTO1 homolog [Macadamia integrifolia]XP_042490633.1 protein LTO1 homolog [Macadamia integrifolia]XP_042490635.1 protein LTO1 homolog [Macadamia integrifolia]
MQSEPAKQAPVDSNSNYNEDIFDPSLNLEETHVKEGYKDGFQDGLVLGQQEGREVGLKVGFEVGEEIGFYRGCVDVWNSAIRAESSCFTPHVQKNVKQMEDLIKLYPILDPENESVQDTLDSLRAKFKAVSASLAMSFSSSSMKLEYDGLRKSSGASDLEF